MSAEDPSALELDGIVKFDGAEGQAGTILPGADGIVINCLDASAPQAEETNQLGTFESAPETNGARVEDVKEEGRPSNSSGGCSSAADGAKEALAPTQEPDTSGLKPYTQPEPVDLPLPSQADHDQGEGDREESGDPDDPKKKPKPPRPDTIEPCPRCCSNDTKFCYYNNYNVKQPRFFCKSCQRYWTSGGTLRNVPVGSGRRKSKSAAAKEQEKQQQALAEQLAKQHNNLMAGANLSVYASALNPMLAAESVLAYNAAAQQQLINTATLNALKNQGVGLGQWPGALAQSAELARLNNLATAGAAGLDPRLLSSLDAATLASLQNSAALVEDGSNQDGRRVRAKGEGSPDVNAQHFAALANSAGGPAALSNLVNQAAAAERAEINNLNRAAWLQQTGQWSTAPAALLTNQGGAAGQADLLQQSAGNAELLSMAANKAAAAQQVAYAQMLQAQALQQAAAQAAVAQAAAGAINNPYLGLQHLYNYNYANAANLAGLAAAYPSSNGAPSVQLPPFGGNPNLQ